MWHPIYILLYSLHLFLSLCLCMSLSLHLFMCVSLSLYVSVSVSPSLPLSAFSLSLSLSLSLYHCHYVAPPFFCYLYLSVFHLYPIAYLFLNGCFRLSHVTFTLFTMPVTSVPMRMTCKTLSQEGQRAAAFCEESIGKVIIKTYNRTKSSKANYRLSVRNASP